MAKQALLRFKQKIDIAEEDSSDEEDADAQEDEADTEANEESTRKETELEF